MSATWQELFDRTTDDGIREQQKRFKRFFHEAPTEQKLQDTRQLLETYSDVKPKDVLSHVLTVRNKAWVINPYPCLGHFNFLDLSISRATGYHEVLQRVKDGQTLLDLGCCFGQDLRKLAADGAPTANLYGADIDAGLIDLGYELFLDRASFRATFVVGDLLAEDHPLQGLEGKLDIVHAASFIHLFDRKTQKEVIHRVCGLLRAQSGSSCFGRQVGSSVPGEVDVGRPMLMFRHDAKSFEELWTEVARERQETWKVEAKLYFEDLDVEDRPKSESAPWLVFSVSRA